MKKNCNWNGCRNNFKLDEEFAWFNKMKIDYLKNLLKSFDDNVKYEYDLKKKLV